MNKLIIAALLSTFSMAEVVNVTKEKSTSICESYINETKAFEKNMKDDEVSKKTLEFYKEKILVHCGSISAKVKFDKKVFAELMTKEQNATVPECRMAIHMASEYSKNKEQSEILVAAHRENIADNCGSIVAGHVSAYCLYGDEED